MSPVGVRSLRTVQRVHNFEPQVASIGQVPQELDGRLYRVGPGRFEDERSKYPHWFDGEGLVTAIDLSNGRASCAIQLIRPAKTEKAPDVWRGRFGRPPRGLWLGLRSLFDPDLYINPANTALLHWNGKLLALYEGDLPTEINSETLSTIGPTNLGVIRRGFGAHLKLHRPSGALINQGFRTPWRPHLDYFALERCGQARLLGSALFSGAALTHDFAVTDNFIVSICSPLFPDIWAIVARGHGVSESLRWRPERGCEILINRFGTDSWPTRRVITDAFFYSHTANAFEDGEDIVIHGIVAEDATGVDWIGSIHHGARSLAPSSRGQLTELRICSRSGRIDRHKLAETAVEFPMIDPRRGGLRQRVVYGVGFKDEALAYQDLFDSVVKIDLECGETTKREFGSGHFVSEAVFAPLSYRYGEDTGWLLSINYDANRDESYLAILDASGELEIVATIPLRQSLPISFHGTWIARSELSNTGPSS